MDKYELYKFESPDKNDRRVWRIYFGIDTGLLNQKFKYGAHTIDGSYGIVLTEFTHAGYPNTILEGTTREKTKITLTMKQFNALPDISKINNGNVHDIININPTNKFKDAIKNDDIRFNERQFSRDIYAKAISKHYKPIIPATSASSS